MSKTDTDVLADSRATLTLHVCDLAAAVRWYSDIFGREPRYTGTDTSLTGNTTSFAAFELAGLVVYLSDTRSSPPSTASHQGPTLVFMTRRPLAGLRLELTARGALFRDDESVSGFPVDQHGVRSGRNTEFFWFYDPDGNKTEFCRMLPAAANQ